ncbi:hypothetical protein Pcinc_008351 [Petrolisthes cinctipes]|uniref:Transposase n=1 Tax=Petrolisthes cinctipes TaxID=88211 RepID=A0AAE1G3R0_PETCI|nr:hypothetical protein Pcinc_010295 [Petrolisthes cinctipes]KAK3887533.1 hypothetical protein Pcinc_008351 [Petrolisthes cinctipes]
MLRGEKNRIALRGRIIGLHDAGKTPSEIPHELGLKKDTVYLWLRRWNEEGKLEDHKRTGRRRVTDANQDRMLRNAAEASPFSTSVALTQESGLPISARTVRRRLHEQGIHHRTPAVKEKLTERHRKIRLQFASDHVAYDMDILGRVVFSDEKTFSSTTHGLMHCWRENNTRYDRRHIYENAKSGHVTCNVWGWISLHGVGELTEINERFTADQYIEILEEVMLPSVRSYLLPYPERIVFVQDRCPVHTARVVRQWFNEHQEIQLLDWPPKGCDMNPIEDVWALMVNGWEPSEERTRQALLHHTQQEWELLRRKPQLIAKSVESMKRRLQEVILMEGGWSSY